MMSFVIHTALVAVVVFFGARQVAKEVDKIVDVKFYAAPPPPPPPPPPASSTRQKTRVEKVQVTPTEIVQPTEVQPVEETPQDVPEEPEDGGVEGGVEGGDPINGVLGGVIGGVVGGEVGGVVGGTGSGIADINEGDLHCTQSPSPEYPPLARKQGITGEVMVEVIFGLDGRPESARVLSGPAIFHQAALSAAKKKVCEPYRSGNVISKSRAKVRFKFSLM